MGREVSSSDNLDTYIGNEHLKEKVSAIFESGDLPHLLLYGKGWYSKTTLFKILVKNIECDYLYINKLLMKTTWIPLETRSRTCASTMGFKDYKIIILDECDYITPISILFSS